MDSNVTAAEDRTTRPAVRRGLIERQRWRLFAEICGLALLAGLAACRPRSQGATRLVFACCQ